MTPFYYQLDGNNDGPFTPTLPNLGRDDSDKRRSDRQLAGGCIFQAAHVRRHAAEMFQAHLHDVSLHGLGFVCTAGLNRGESFTLAVPIGPEILFVACRVVHCDEPTRRGVDHLSDGPPVQRFVGAEFTAVCEPNHARLREPSTIQRELIFDAAMQRTSCLRLQPN
ncbi:MAG: PilZ domain-containing protein [Phycisphaerae bacterium]